MTTVAWDGNIMASDTLCSDDWGLKTEMRDKIKTGKDFYIGFSGAVSEIEKYWSTIKNKTFDELLEYGNPFFDQEKAGFQALLVSSKYSCYLIGGRYKKIHRGYHAIGSGRDFAFSAMHLGKTAIEAVKIASEYDVNTGFETVSYKLRDLHKGEE